MDFQKLVEVYEELEKTSSGNAMREILANFYKSIPKKVPRIRYPKVDNATLPVRMRSII